jgi:hypothetical protein
MDAQTRAGISVDILAASVKDLQLYCKSRIDSNDSTSGHDQVVLMCRHVSAAVDHVQLALLYHQEVDLFLPSTRTDDASSAALSRIQHLCQALFRVLAGQVESGILKPARHPIRIPAPYIKNLESRLEPIVRHTSDLCESLRQYVSEPPLTTAKSVSQNVRFADQAMDRQVAPATRGRVKKSRQ